ncbi:hypothetical protein MXB_4893, partial [Myxobolus squamalis]
MKDHHQTTLSNPFILTTRNELVDNALCSVGKIPKLSFPYTVFKTQYPVLGKRAIADTIFFLRRRKIVEWTICYFFNYIVIEDVVRTCTPVVNRDENAAISAIAQSNKPLLRSSERCEKTLFIPGWRLKDS